MIGQVLTDGLDRGKQGADGLARAGRRLDQQTIALLDATVDLRGKAVLLLAKGVEREGKIVRAGDRVFALA